MSEPEMGIGARAVSPGSSFSNYDLYLGRRHELWWQAQVLCSRLIHLSGEADLAYLKGVHNRARAERSRRLGWLAIRAGERALRRQRAVVREQEARMRMRVFRDDQ